MQKSKLKLKIQNLPKFIHNSSFIIHNSSKGFTLIEILVAATIISLLAAIGIASYGSANKSSRDARRKADIEQVRAALEIYRADISSYPADLATLVPTYIAQIPVDPKNSTDPETYTYNYSATATTYCISANLETIPASTDSCVASGFNYAVSNP